MSNRAEMLPSAASGFGTEGLPRRNALKEKLNTVALGAALPILLLIAWQVLGDAGIVSRLLFPTPYSIFLAFKRLILSGELQSNLQISLIRALAGFALGGSLGLLFGVCVGLFRGTERALDPSVQMIRMIPHLAIAPLFILWFGIGESSKILLIAKGAFFPLYINTFLGIRNVDNKLFEVAKVLEFSRFKQVVKLVIPGALPHIVLGIRLSLGLSWLGLVVAELMGATEGIGYMMSDARQFSKTSVVFVGIITFAVLGHLADTLIRLVERRLLRWRDSFDGN